MNKEFSLREIISTAWGLAKKNIWVVMGFTAIQFMVIMLTTGLLIGLLGSSGVVPLIQKLLITLINSFFTVAIYQVFFKLIDEEGDPTFPDFMPSVIKALNLILVQVIIYAFAILVIATVAGIYFFNYSEIDPASLIHWKNAPLLIAISIPIAYVSIRMSFVVCFIVDQDSSAMEAISQSWLITKGYFWLLVVLFLAIIGINMLGAIALFVGLLFTVPLSGLIIIVAYRQMVNSYEENLLENMDDEFESSPE